MSAGSVSLYSLLTVGRASPRLSTGMGGGLALTIQIGAVQAQWHATFSWSVQSQ